MCGRFTRHYTWREIYELYQLTLGSNQSNLPPRYNICPTTPIDAVVRAGGDQRELVSMRWGLVPRWWKKSLKELPATFNARAETVAEKPMFRDAFKWRRCLIPASGYYEWLLTPDGKQPFYFTRRDGQVMTIAGVYDEWKNSEDGKTLKSCAMVIGTSNRFVSAFHDRMPIVLEADNFKQWGRGEAPEAAELLKSAGEDVLQAWPVSRRVNSSRTSDEDATLIEKTAA
jgi:putative SOS response-associated peptidase YedK